MSTRVSIKDLEAIAARLNRMTGSPPVPWAVKLDDPQNRMVAQIGNFHISQCYGGVSLHRMVSDGGGVSDVLSCGHVPRRELQTAMFAFIRGMEVQS